MKTYTTTLTAITGISIRISDTARTLAAFAVLFLIYATVDGLADVFFGGVL